MQDMKSVISAYAAAAAHRSLRQQEADVLRRVNASLRHARTSGSALERVRALSENDHLWLTISGLLKDSANQLPAGLRAQLIGVGRAVQNEIQGPAPDFDFLIAINENIIGALDHGGVARPE